MVWSIVVLGAFLCVTPSTEAKERKAEANPSPASPAVTWDGGAITYAELAEQARPTLQRAEYEYQTQRYQTLLAAANDTVDQMLLEREAQRRGLGTPEALLTSITASQTVSDAEIDEFLAQNAAEIEGRNPADFRPQVRQLLLEQKQNLAAETLVEELRTRNHVTIRLQPPEPLRVDVGIDDDAIRGDKRAPVTIIEFADFQCPFCARADATVESLVDAYGGKVRWVFRDYPLPFHARALPAAIAAECAGRQGRFWEMHDLIMENQRSLEDEDLASFAGRAGVNVDHWRACLADPAIQAEIEHDKDDAAKVGVVGTPTFFINGALLNGAQPEARFRESIDAELQRAR